MEKTCEDFKLLGNFEAPKNAVCEECVNSNSTWVHLRTCLTCGKTLCCDSSKNQHMTKHYHATKHPAIISAEPNERWIFCYKHDIFSPY